MWIILNIFISPQAVCRKWLIILFKISRIWNGYDTCVMQSINMFTQHYQMFIVNYCISYIQRRIQWLLSLYLYLFSVGNTEIFVSINSLADVLTYYQQFSNCYISFTFVVVELTKSSTFRFHQRRPVWYGESILLQWRCTKILCMIRS